MQKQREHWSSQLGFVLAAAGAAIGLGTLWMFPYIVGRNGGGIFVILYIACTFLIGIPLFMAELILGRKAQRGPVGIFIDLANNSPLWKSAGWLGVFSSFLIITYYSVIAGWGLNYILMSLNQFYHGRSAHEIAQIFDIVSSSADITLFWQVIFVSLTMAVVYPGVRQGIEFWNKFMTSGLLILLTGLFCYSLTLDGFTEAFHFVFSPSLGNFKPSSAIEALGLSFFTLSLAQGIMLTYGSYMRRTDDIPKTSFIIGSMVILVACLSALTIFPVIFTFGMSPQSGAGLVFKTLPFLFGKLPGGLLISTLFFTMFVFTALTSAVALVEVVVANFMDLWGWNRKKSVIVVGVAALVCGIPSALSDTNLLFGNWKAIYGKTFFDTISDFVSFWLIPIGGLLIAIYTGWFFDKKISKEEFSAGTRMGWLWRPWLFFLRWIVPLGIFAVLLEKTELISLDGIFGGLISR